MSKGFKLLFVISIMLFVSGCFSQDEDGLNIPDFIQQKYQAYNLTTPMPIYYEFSKNDCSLTVDGKDCECNVLNYYEENLESGTAYILTIEFKLKDDTNKIDIMFDSSGNQGLTFSDINDVATVKDLILNSQAQIKKFNEEKKEYHKQYNLLSLNNGKKATITFKKDGICDVDFSDFTNNNKKDLYIIYNKGNCTYTTTNDKDLTIKYEGTFDFYTTWYDSYTKKMKKHIINSAAVMPNAKITFNDDYTSFEYKNGKWDGQTGEVFYYYFKEDTVKNDENTNSNNSSNSNNSNSTTNNNNSNSSNNTNNNVSNNNSTNSNNSSNSSTSNNNNNNNKEEDLKKQEEQRIQNEYKEALESANLNISVNGYEYTVKLDVESYYGPYKVKINGNSYDVNSSMRLIKTKFTKVGELCFETSITNKYGHVKNINKCISAPTLPDFTVDLDSHDMNGRWNANIWRKDNNSRINSKDITCLLDGNEVECSYSFKMTAGNHKIEIVDILGQRKEYFKECPKVIW